MTAEEFRELVLALPGAVEGEHMRHPDFRAHGKVFATLGYPTEEYAMVKVDPPEQKRLVEVHGHIFLPVKGAWGLQGCTQVILAAAKREVVAHALDLAWQKSAAEAGRRKAPAKKSAKKAVKRAGQKADASRS